MTKKRLRLQVPNGDPPVAVAAAARPGPSTADELGKWDHVFHATVDNAERTCAVLDGGILLNSEYAGILGGAGHRVGLNIRAECMLIRCCVFC